MMVSTPRILNERLKYSINILQINARLMIMEVFYRPLVPRLMHLYLVSINKDQIIRIINYLNSNKAHGCDGISVSMLKLCAAEVATPLLVIFRKCIQSGVY